MEIQKRKRAVNWSKEEKDILRQLISESADIIENKSNNTISNMKKKEEWQNITRKFNEMLGKSRDVNELKLTWKRMKLAAKLNISTYNREINKTGGGEKPPSPSPDDLAVVSIAPRDFIVEYNDYDSDAVQLTQDLTAARPSTSPLLPILQEISVNVQANSSSTQPALQEPARTANPNTASITLEPARTANPNTASITREPARTVNPNTRAMKRKPNKRRNEDMHLEIIKSNTNFKKRQLEMSEVEHDLNVKIAKLKIKKLELEISLLEEKKNKEN